MHDRRKGDLLAVDFFCGAGGLTRGLLDAGINVILGLDNAESCRKTYEANNPEARFLVRDIRHCSVADLATELGDVPSDSLLFAACAPCQPFSKQRTNSRSQHQRTLLLEFVRFVATFEPEFVLVENVPGIARAKGSSTYRRFVSKLNQMRYKIDAKDIDAKDYGVPQTRRRHVLLASKSNSIRIPEPVHGPGLLPYRTVRDTIVHYPAIGAGKVHAAVPNHRASQLSETNLLRMSKTPHNGGNRRDWPAELVLECHKGDYEGHTDVYGRMWWDRPAPALTCKCHSLSNGRYGHPEQDRAISLREAAALQSFPDDYVFYGTSKASIGNQIGNAVPVKLAEALGKAILACASASTGQGSREGIEEGSSSLL
jgi:DNA (cytosine-5)-methyltransferase 1